MVAYATNLDYLQDELQRLDLLLADAIAQFRHQRDQTVPQEFQGFYLSDAEIDRLVNRDNQPETAPATETRQKAAHCYEILQQRISASLEVGLWLRLPHLSKTFGLSPFEQDLLLLALAPEIDPRYQKLYAYLQDNVERKRPTVALALTLFCQSLAERVLARSRFMQDAPLLSHHLVQLQDDPHERPTPLLSQGLQLDTRLVQFLLGDDHLDARLSQPLPLARWVSPHQSLKELVLPEAVYRALANLSQQSSNSPRMCLLQGPDGVGKKACAGAIAATWKQPLLVIDLLTLLKSGQPTLERLQLVWREGKLYGGLIYLDNWQTVTAAEEDQAFKICRWVEQAVGQAPGLVCLGSQSSWHPSAGFAYPFISLEIPLPDEPLRQQLWIKFLGRLKPNPISKAPDQNGDPVGVNGRLPPPMGDVQKEFEMSYPISAPDLTYLISAFRFSGGQIQQAIAQATYQAQLKQRDLHTDDLIAGSRFVSQQQLIKFAQRLNPKRCWNDLVLPANILDQLQDFCQHIRHRTRVYNQWGFSDKLTLGKGLTALFTGASGTGKTLSAEVLATETGLDLYRVDLASVVSKYIGETEKNLSRVFQDAQTSNAILFFDEADALFGKRSDVKDAHDRYANIEVNYLLQQVEDYEGAIILASNYSKNIDDAFLRRLQFKVEFPFPNEALRLAIWQRIFPAQAPLAADVDCEFLSRQFKLSGGNIKNVALAAAFRAAEADSEIGMPQIILGVKREYQKLGKVCDKSDFGPFYDLVR